MNQIVKILLKDGHSRRKSTGKHLSYQRKIYDEFPRLSMRNGILCRELQVPNRDEVIQQVVLPKCLVDFVLEVMHITLSIGHSCSLMLKSCVCIVRDA